MSDPNRYIKVPVRLYDIVQAERGDEIIDSVIVKVRVLPFCVESYHPIAPEHLALKPENMVSTKVTMKSGDEFIADMKIDEFEKIMFPE